MNEINVLDVLDQMDKFRRTHQDERQSPPDFCMRVMEAILAQAAGFKSRTDWTDALKANENSEYSKDLKDTTLIVNF